jgi:hypothetical protein
MISVEDFKKRFGSFENFSYGDVDRLLHAAKVIEEEYPEECAPEHLVNVMTEHLFQTLDPRYLTEPRLRYRRVIEKMSLRLEHPFLLIMIVPTIMQFATKEKRDAMVIFEEILRVMRHPAPRRL